MVEQNSHRPGNTMPRLFGEIPRDEPVREERVLPTAEVESPKSPDFRDGARVTRFSLPSISRIWSRGPPREQNQDATHPDIESQLPSPNRENWDIPLPPEPATHSRSTIRVVSSHYPETETVSRESDEERRRRRRRRHRERDGRRKRRGKPPQRFLYCFPWVKSKRMRANILRCFVSGLFLIILLTVCKSPTALKHRNLLIMSRPRVVREQPDQHGRIHHRLDLDRHPSHSFLLLRPHQAMHASDETR